MTDREESRVEIWHYQNPRLVDCKIFAGMAKPEDVIKYVYRHDFSGFCWRCAMEVDQW